jgi:surface carbohydrate biosynthesis protein
MAIYIAVEVSRRELEGRLLLGLVAAERGYDVVLGKIPHAALLAEELNGWRLPPGILHLKSIASSQRIYERFDRLRAGGTLITVQDEEHGLTAQRDYAEFGELRFPPEAVRLANRIMAWGPRDAEWLRVTYDRLRESVVVTGSPRMDLWRPDLIESATAPPDGRGHILIASTISPFSHNPFWVAVLNSRIGAFGPGYDGDEDPKEFVEYEFMADAFQYVKHLVLAVRRLAKRHPDRTIVFRPHHFEPAEAWEALLGPYPNVIVRADGPARPWVRDAAVVIFSGSTLGLEASVAGRPGVAFMPDGLFVAHPVNVLGFPANDAGALADAVGAILGSTAGRHSTSEANAFLASRLAALDGPLAADRIVDEWERMLTPETSGRVEYMPRPSVIGERVRRPLRAVRGVARRVGARRPPILTGRASAGDKGPYAMEVEHKFPSLDFDALREDARRLSNHLGRFASVEIVQIGEREVLLRAAHR